MEGYCSDVDSFDFFEQSGLAISEVEIVVLSSISDYQAMPTLRVQVDVPDAGGPFLVGQQTQEVLVFCLGQLVSLEL